MLWNPLAGLCGLLFCSMMALIFVSSVRRSSFGWLILFIEYFYVLGLGVFPLLLSVGVIDAPQLAVDYESQNGELAVATFVHIFLYGLGALFGYFGARPLARKVSLRVASFAADSKINNYAWFYIVSGLSILFSGLYFNIMGLENAVVNASFARGGDFSRIGGFEQYQFLKTLAMIGVFSMVFVPYIIIDGKHIKSTFLIIALVAFLFYLLNVSRTVFFDTLVLFTILYLIFGRFNFGSIIYSIVIFLFIIFVFWFGKGFVYALSVYLFGGGDLDLIVQNESASAIFFGQFGFLVYSIDAGIRNFFSHGPLLSQDVLLSPLGFLPSFAYSAVGLDFLSYQLVDQSECLSCINTQYFSYDDCTIPPHFMGVSAYLLPVVGGFFFGFVRFFIYSVIEISWMRLRDYPKLLWVPLFLLFIAHRLMLFIPGTISFAFFVLVALLFILKLRKVVRVDNPPSSALTSAVQR